MEDGMVKYARDNWRAATTDWREAYSGAASRHASELADPDCADFADDTGIHHAAGMIASGLIYLYHAERERRDQGLSSLADIRSVNVIADGILRSGDSPARNEALECLERQEHESGAVTVKMRGRAIDRMKGILRTKGVIE